jgi:hypothetical protein
VISQQRRGFKFKVIGQKCDAACKVVSLGFVHRNHLRCNSPTVSEMGFSVFSGAEGKETPSLCNASRHNHALTMDDPGSPPPPTPYKIRNYSYYVHKKTETKPISETLVFLHEVQKKYLKRKLYYVNRLL